MQTTPSATCCAGGVVCNGAYRRVLGFTEKELSRHRSFSFQIAFAPDGDSLMRARRIALQSVYGLATLDRR